ncbi:hypothetical protein [Variovorax sp. PCZ-1]|uniref:hypothetical protein n=1 Tax=Variovorax sp. PCZ-1 TaxID=2835533 RepID=UPI001BCC1412|nr:hypothetical protein [Variovorax sp. PCZ-1]MBS7807366.1 hypothetical protein [Variovorax sp. PCZ-1]
MRDIVKRFPYAFAGLVSGLVLFVLAAALDLDVFEELVTLIHKGEALEIDEFVIPIMLVAFGICCDFVSTSVVMKKEQEKLEVYNKMSNEVMEEISNHLTKLLEFRTTLMKDAPDSKHLRYELDRIIVTSFNHYEQAQRRGNIDLSLMPLVMSSQKVDSAHAGLPEQSSATKITSGKDSQ